jgi:hypothetical protein
MQIIPFKEPAAFQQQITLTSVIFILYFRWNAMNQYWVMNIYDRNDQPILLGVKVVTNFNLTAQFAALTGMPSGDILCQNLLGLWDTIQRFDMGQTTEIIYYEPGELKVDAS